MDIFIRYVHVYGMDTYSLDVRGERRKKTVEWT